MGSIWVIKSPLFMKLQCSEMISLLFFFFAEMYHSVSHMCIGRQVWSSQILGKVCLSFCCRVPDIQRSRQLAKRQFGTLATLLSPLTPQSHTKHHPGNQNRADRSPGCTEQWGQASAGRCLKNMIMQK